MEVKDALAAFSVNDEVHRSSINFWNDSCVQTLVEHIQIKSWPVRLAILLVFKVVELSHYFPC